MKAAIWIKENTQIESAFVSQRSNNKLIVFFGERKIISPNSEFFLSDKIIKQDEVVTCDEQKTIEIDKARNNLMRFDIIYGNIGEFESIIKDSRSNIKNINKECYPKEIFTYSPMYILYSEAKLEGLYSTRKWWRDINYYGANLEKFNYFPLVYDAGGVKIWKLK